MAENKPSDGIKSPLSQGTPGPLPAGGPTGPTGPAKLTSGTPASEDPKQAEKQREAEETPVRQQTANQHVEMVTGEPERYRSYGASNTDVANSAVLTKEPAWTKRDDLDKDASTVLKVIEPVSTPLSLDASLNGTLTTSAHAGAVGGMLRKNYGTCPAADCKAPSNFQHYLATKDEKPIRACERHIFAALRPGEYAVDLNDQHRKVVNG